MSINKLTGTSSLAQFILGLYDDWGQDRKTKYETGWQANYDAMTGTNGDYWQNNAWKLKEGKDWRSKSFPLVIKTKVLAGYAIVVDTVLQGGEIPFALIPNDEEDQDPLVMEKKIKKQFSICKADREFMKVIMSMALFGFGYVKSPIIKSYTMAGFKKVVPQLPPALLMTQGIQQPPVSYQPYLNQITGPAVEYASVWDIYRDWEYEDIQEGVGLIHRQMTAPFWLRNLIGKKYFLEGAIEKVIAEAETTNTVGNTDDQLAPYLRNITNRHRTINRIEFWGRVPKKLVEEFDGFAKEKNMGEVTLDNGLTLMDEETSGKEVEIFCTIANGDVIALTDVAPNDRPFFGAKWEPMLDDILGRSIADNLQDSQKMVNGIVRAIADNSALVSNVVLAMKPEMFENPTDEVYPGLRLLMSEDCDDIRKGIQQLQIGDVCGPLYNFFQLAMQFADDNSNLPKLISGEVVQKKRETAFEIDARQQNAGKYVGQVIRNLDEGIIEPVGGSFYKYNMLGENPKEQGDFTVSGTGFSSFQNRYVRMNKLMQMLQLSLANPMVFQETKIRPLLEELYKMQDLEVDKFLKSEEEKQIEQMRSIQGVVMRICQVFRLDPNQVMQVVQQTQQPKLPPQQG